MKYISLDIETTGLDPVRCQVLEIALVWEDTDDIRPIEELPSFHCYVDHPEIRGNAYALQMNQKILQEIAAGKGVAAGNVSGLIQDFLTTVSGSDTLRLTVAGKNVAGFDLPFLRNGGLLQFDRFLHRVIDPGSVFVDWSKKCLPSLGDLTGRKVAHTALEDARDVIRILRRQYAPATV